jgi:hypothetical protein
VHPSVHVDPAQLRTWFVEGGHAAQAPPQQMPASQLVPSGLSPVETHVGWPVLHEIVPAWQTFSFGWHGAPSVHAPHTPFRHT